MSAQKKPNDMLGVLLFAMGLLLLGLVVAALLA